jgi:uncharacterized membrane protein HdeD (DUF308 family)
MVILVDNWWAFVVRGIAGVIFGLIACFAPPLALLTLVFLFAFYAITDGILGVIAAFHRRGDAAGREPWWALLIGGIISLIAGGMAFFLPAAAAFALLMLIAAWAVGTGIMSIIASVRLRKQIRGEWLLALSGVLAIVFGILIAIFPGAGALAVVLWIGAYAFAYGILLIALGFRLRTSARRPEDAGLGRHDGVPAIAH